MLGKSGHFNQPVSTRSGSNTNSSAIMPQHQQMSKVMNFHPQPNQMKMKLGGSDPKDMPIANVIKASHRLAPKQ